MALRLGDQVFSFPAPPPTPSPANRPVHREVVRSAYDAQATEYDTAFVDPVSLAENAVVRRLLHAHHIGAGHVLDLGCGTGLTLELMPIPPERYVGLDLSPGMLHEAARKFPRHTFIAGDMGLLPLAYGTVSTERFLGHIKMNEPLHLGRAFTSVVSLFGALNYVEHPMMVISEILDVLAPGGRVFLLTLTDRYFSYPGHVLQSTLQYARPIPYDHLQKMLKPFEDVRFYGVHLTIPRLLPKAAPAGLYGALMRLETATLGRLFPASGYFTIVTGRRP